MDDKKLNPIQITEDVWMVPCLMTKDKKEYQPIGKPFNSDFNWDRVQCRQSWLQAEDETLKDIISQRGPHHWSLIAREVNSIVHKGLPVRQGKQCRER